MHPTGWEAEKSIRRAPARARVLLMLASLGEAHPRALAAAAGVDATRLEWIMRGHPPEYSEELALLTLGLAREIRTKAGRAFEITTRGRKKARQLTARAARKAARRAAERAGAAPPAPVRTPASTAEFRCTYTCHP